MSQPTPAQPEGWSFPRGMALLVACAFFMEILDATIIAPAIPLIAGSFGVEAVDVNVAISAYMVTVAVLIPATGWMADRFGVRRVFVAAIAVFTIASIGCAASVSLPMLVGMRVLQGIGGAMMVPVGRLAVLRYSDKSDLVRAIALLTWPALAAPVIAPALGGAIATFAIVAVDLPDQHPDRNRRILTGAQAGTRRADALGAPAGLARHVADRRWNLGGTHRARADPRQRDRLAVRRDRGCGRSGAAGLGGPAPAALRRRRSYNQRSYASKRCGSP